MKFNIETIKRKMLVKYPFFGSVVANVEYRENNKISTAGTDGKVVHYNRYFLEKLSIQEQVFIFAHEICHIAFNHILRSEGKEPKLWNIATDGVINAFLKKDGLKMVEGGVDIEDAINYDAEELYNKLLKEKEQNQKENSQNGEGKKTQNSHGNEGQNISSVGKQNQTEVSSSEEGQSSDSLNDENKEDSKENDCSSNGNEKNKDKDAGHDTHSMWEDAVKKHKEESENNNSKEDNKDSFKEGNASQDDKQKEIEKKQEELSEMGEREAFNENIKEKIRELEELKTLLSKESVAGTTSNGDVRRVSDIGRSKPIMDWRYVLREAVYYDVDWSYKNAYIEDGVVHAALEEQPMPEVEIVLDTSGSVNETLLKNFLRECKNILEYSKVKVGCFDTKFYGFHEIRNEEDIENMRFQGGGGTNFDVAVNAFSRRVENKIIFTDGEAKIPQMSLDAIWIVFGDRKINPKGGKVINITGEDLRRLYSNQNNYSGKRR